MDGAALGLAAAADHGHDLVTLGEAADPGSDRLDLTSQLEARDVGR